MKHGRSRDSRSVKLEKDVALRLEQKQEIVAEVNDAASSALSAVLADYRGLTVAEMTELRVKARETGVYLLSLIHI